jgi:hypothetical protein
MEQIVRVVLLILVGGVLAFGQAAPTQNAAPPRDSLTLQREAVRIQAAAAAAIGGAPAQAPLPPADTFFTVPWPEPLPPPDVDCDPMPAAELSALVRAASEREHVKADLIQAVIQQESGSKPCAVSPKGAMGLMQLMPDVAERMRVKDPFDPKESVDGGVKLLKQLLDKYKGDVSLALGAYNAGEQKVDQTGTVPDIPETKNYVKSITRQISTPAAVGDGQATH